MKNKKIIALTDYKNKFGSKHFDKPYRSGMDKKLLADCFNELGFDLQFMQFTKVLNADTIEKDAFYIYTSSEDINYLYKSFIEDVVFFLEEQNCNMIPSYKFLRANNNKVFMELLRGATNDKSMISIQSQVFGVKEELQAVIKSVKYPVIVKSAEGASGTGVFKALNEQQLLKAVDKIAASKNFFYDMKEIGRTHKHKGYIKESGFRKKFIIQNMIPDLKNDWKVYFFFDKLFIFYRPIFKHRDFRASGGGYDNYLYDEQAPKPEGFFEFVSTVIKNFNVPHASLDIAYDGKNFHLIEIQFLYFGTAGIPYSKGYYINNSGQWMFIENKLSIEKVFAESISAFIRSKEY